MLNVVRALYFQSRVPLHFLSHYVLTIAFLINCTLSPLLHNSTPYELLYKQSVDYSCFRVFGCLAFASTLASQRIKFQPRARTCVFLGYPNGMKAYRLFDIHTKQVFVSRYVIFHEHVFPFHTISPIDHLSDPFPDLVLPHPLPDFPTSTLPNTHQSPSPLSDSLNHVSLPSSLPARKSTQVTKPPSYLCDYHFHLAVSTDSCSPTSTHAHPLSQVLSYHFLSPTYRNFIIQISSSFEPQFYHQAVKFPQWREAMQAELDAMELNKTWTLTHLPPGKNSVGCRWIYKIKYKSDCSIERHKARLVAKGYTQQEGVDYIGTFHQLPSLLLLRFYWLWQLVNNGPYSNLM